jgi:hypothetical protein
VRGQLYRKNTVIHPDHQFGPVAGVCWEKDAWALLSVRQVINPACCKSNGWNLKAVQLLQTRLLFWCADFLSFENKAHFSSVINLPVQHLTSPDRKSSRASV